jgi:hypothetical protein|tara:strand:- start:1132 stop:1401 length:270 start_codon:yes stop_codon:yes gene_type:complete
MEIYWEFTRKGQKLNLQNGEKLEIIGGVRETKSGYDAFAKTFSMTPERAQKGFPSMDIAKEFVESFRPWELYTGPIDITVDSEVREAIV